jgi:hypothetical protein
MKAEARKDSPRIYTDTHGSGRVLLMFFHLMFFYLMFFHLMFFDMMFFDS